MKIKWSLVQSGVAADTFSNYQDIETVFFSRETICKRILLIHVDIMRQWQTHLSVNLFEEMLGTKKTVVGGFEPPISYLLDTRFNR